MPEPRRWTFRSFERSPGRLPLLMGIVNVTPDSFSDGGRFASAAEVVDHACQLVEDGADILDVGGESTRPGSEPVSLDEELKRVIPVIEQLATAVSVPVSIDTTKAEVARRAIQAGATIVNDISGLTYDGSMVDVCADSDVGVICMHMQGTPQTMQDDPQYDNVVEDVLRYLTKRLDALEQCGIARDRVVLDPGVGFGKTAEHNLKLLQNIERLRSTGRPVLVGHSRKRFLGRVLGRKVEERTAGTIGVSIGLAAQAVDILRVHDVRAVRDALVAWHAVAVPGR